MSTSSVSRTIKFIQKSGTFTAIIMSPSGDLYQEYIGEPSTTTNVIPNFENSKPEIYFVCTSSRSSVGTVTPDGMEYYFNGTKIDFSGVDSIGAYAGVFKKIQPGTGQPYYGLKIMKNLVYYTLGAPASIKMKATISSGVQSDVIEASYVIPIQVSTGGDTYKVTIASGDNNYFVIREKGGSCVLKAVAYLAGAVVSGGMSYVWEKMTSSGWSAITGNTSSTLTVYESDIDTYAEYRVTISKGGATIGSDMQGVMDVSDPLMINANPIPEDETITDDASDTSRSSVVYTPKVVNRSGVQITNQPLFYFTVVDASGNILNASSYNTAKASETVTRGMCVQGGGDVSIIITSQDVSI